MIERWFLFYDGACPLCFQTQNKLYNLLSNDVRLTTVDLNSTIGRISKEYNQITLETPNHTYVGHHACLQILSKTKYKWATHLLFRPIFILGYLIISKNRKLISKIIRK